MIRSSTLKVTSDEHFWLRDNMTGQVRMIFLQGQEEIWIAILLNLSTEILFYDIVIGVVTAGL